MDIKIGQTSRIENLQTPLPLIDPNVEEGQGQSIQSQTTESIGVLEAQAWKARNESHKNAVDILLAVTNDDSQILLFLNAAKNAINNGHGNWVDSIARGMSEFIKVADKEQWKLFKSAAENVIKNRSGYYVGGIARGMSAFIKVANQEQWKLFENAAKNAINNGHGNWVDSIARGMSELIKVANQEQWKLFENAIKNGYGHCVGSIADGMSEFIKAGADEGEVKLFLSAAENAIKNGNGHYVREIALGMSELIKAGADEGNVKLFLSAAENEIKNGNGHCVGEIAYGMSKLIERGFSYEKIEKVLGVFSEVIELNNLEGLGYEERKVDLRFWFSENVVAIGNLEKISPGVHKKVKSDTLGIKKDDTWTERKNPLLYTEEIAVFNTLTADEVNELTSLYEKNKTLFDNNQSTFLRVVRLIKSCKEAGIPLDLNKDYISADEVVNSFGKELFLALATKLSITTPKEVDIGRFLESWDLEHLGSLISTQKSWDDEDKALFTLLIESGLNGNLKEILSQSETHDNFVKEMEESGLNAKDWLNAHNLISESSTLSMSKTKTPQELLKEFRNQFNTFQQYLENNPTVFTEKTNAWNKILTSEQIKQVTKENAKPNVLTNPANHNYITEKLKGFIDSLKEKLPQGAMPEAISDLERTINEIKDYKPPEKKEERKEDITVSIWDPSDIGHNLFAGNRANSCTALGSNAKAIFYFICDPGTKYIFTRNKRGNITGYARVFLAKVDGKVKLFIDSVDGRAGLKGDYQTPIEPVRQKAKELCKLIGLSEDDIIDRSTKLSGKIGGMSDKYFHHAQFES